MSYATEMKSDIEVKQMETHNYHMERSTVMKYAEEISHAYSEGIRRNYLMCIKTVQMYMTQNVSL